MAREIRPDLILMDLGLPGVDGWRATEMLKGDPETSSIPVIAVTVHVHETDRAAAESSGCDSFMPKPCSPTSLCVEVERMLAR